MSSYITKEIYLEKPKQQVIWSEESIGFARHRSVGKLLISVNEMQHTAFDKLLKRYAISRHGGHGYKISKSPK
jgi:apolipoprotein N-acyltransferase